MPLNGQLLYRRLCGNLILSIASLRSDLHFRVGVAQFHSAGVKGMCGKETAEIRNKVNFLSVCFEFIFYRDALVGAAPQRNMVSARIVLEYRDYRRYLPHVIIYVIVICLNRAGVIQR